MSETLAFDPTLKIYTRFYTPCPECRTVSGYERVCKGHPVNEENQVPWKPTFASLMAANHSIRRLLYEYWHGNLSPEAEAIVESEVPPNILFAHKPSDYH